MSRIEKSRIRARVWYQANRDRAIRSMQRWATENPDRAREIKDRWVVNNPEVRKKSSREWNKRNRPQIKKQALARYWSDPAARILSVQRVRIRRALRGSMKADNTLALVGCSSEQLQEWLEVQFSPGMSWQNYGQAWQIDHARPCASFDLARPEDQRRCFHFSNLQPMFSEENASKGGRYL
jgi:hypothetical protein